MEDDELTKESRLDWRREAAIVTGALLVGLVALPLAITTVGKSLVGPYEGGEGLLALAEQLWLDTLAFRPAAWVLILSPYALAQLLRFMWLVWRRRTL